MPEGRLGREGTTPTLRDKGVGLCKKTHQTSKAEKIRKVLPLEYLVAPDETVESG